MSNLHKANLTYNYRTDESKLKLSDNWKDLPSIHRLDALQEFQYYLEELYEQTYNEHIGGYKEPLIGEALLQNMGHENKEEGALEEGFKDKIIDNLNLQIRK